MNLFRNLLFWLLLALAGAVLAQVLVQDPGFVLVRYLGTTVESTLVGGLLMLGTVLFTLWLLWKLVALPFRLWRQRRERHARARLGDGFEALHQGRYAQAEKLLSKSAQNPRFEAPARVAAAQAALARGDAVAAAAHLDALPTQHAPLRALVLADAALAEGRAAEATAALDAVADQALPPRALALRADALAAHGRSAEAYGMLGALRQQQALTVSQCAERERLWATRMLEEADDGNALAGHWDTLPATLRTVPAVARAYADRAAALRWDDAAAGCLEQAIDTQWDDALAAHYGALPVERLDAASLARRRAHAERWRLAHPDNPGALLGLARIARAQGEWPLAEQALHRAIAAGGDASKADISEAHAWKAHVCEAHLWEELGHGFAQAGDNAQAQLSYRNALRTLRGETADTLAVQPLERPHPLGDTTGDLHDAPGLPPT